ncbi:MULTISPECIES: nuclear transport factor 2 family protein [unclassified Caballeronia]|uniref:nuclear transport factor 2 family protein n=1 Tax=unclassified Caballeronia TaxID=2646786 RepID=UPI001F227AAC|nr:MULTISPECIES: nuclear transport factor 2 family protein [unclassified Caballeronia]MCE4546074.1 nuclear transport factor 2 family protein [Caballeronia sp. PC1]MCE4573453.1 nuclear transport factor 2 family protein [Caballeronia sp. CLC5]
MNALPHEQEFIRKLEDERYEAMLTKDIPTLARLLDEGLVYVHSSGVTDSKESYLNGLASGLWDYRQIGRSDVRIEVHDGVALVFGKLAIQLATKGVSRGFETRALVVWSRKPDGWRLIAVHSGALPAAS